MMVCIGHRAGLCALLGGAALGATLLMSAGDGRAAGESLLLKVEPPVLDAKKCTLAATPKVDRDWTRWHGEATPVSPDAMLDVATAYAKGTDEVPQNVDTARRLLDQLVDKKTKAAPGALFALGKLTLETSTDPKEIAGAIAKMEQAVKQRNAAAAVALGQYYETGRMVRRDPVKAAAYYRIGAIAGNVQSILGLARLAKAGALPDMTPQNVEESVHFALTSLLAAVGRGDCEQAFVIGTLYAGGDIVPLDFGLAAHWYEAAARVGHAKAAEEVARYYKDGFGVSMSAPKMVTYLEIAAKGGRIRGMYNLAQAYAIGDGTEPNREKAQFWFEKTEKRGKPEVLRWLARLWRGEFGGASDPAKSVAYLLRDVEAPVPDKRSLYELGIAYRDGVGAKPDVAKAIDFFSRAAALDHKDAAEAVGDIYRNGEGVAADAMKAARFYRLAAAAGNVGAMTALSDMHRCGIGIAWSPELALKWRERAGFAGSGSSLRGYALSSLPEGDAAEKVRFLRRAARLDSREAMVLLYIAHTLGDGVEADEAKAKQWLDAALAPGDLQVRGFVALANAYTQGQGLPVDVEKARGILEEAARVSPAEGNYELARFLRDRTAAGPAQLRPLLQGAAKAGDPKAMRALANDMKDDEIVEGRNARQWNEAAAAAGDIRARIAMLRGGPDPARIEAGLDRVAAQGACQPDQMADLAAAYLVLDGTSPHDKGMLWLDRAAKIGSGDPGVLFVLGSSLVRATGDTSRGAELLIRAADQGSVKAMRSLAESYEQGEGADPDKAELWHEKAAAAGDPNSAVDYAKIVASSASRRSPEELARARDMLRASAANVPDAARQLGQLSLKGAFGAQARTEAVQWLEKAASTGDVRAMRDLSDAYSVGNGVPRDPNRAFRWLEEAAKHGNGASMFALAAAYETGFGATANPDLARKWYAAAKDAGFSETMK